MITIRRLVKVELQAVFEAGLAIFQPLPSEQHTYHDLRVWKEFMDKFNRVGIIPVSLIYWEMTGDKSMLNSAIEGAK
jgi:hypothetical protein